MNAAASGFPLVSQLALVLDPNVSTQLRGLVLPVACLAFGAVVAFALRAFPGLRFQPLRWLGRVPRNSIAAMALLIVVSLAGRFVDWHWRAVKVPRNFDEFSYLLQAE